MPAQWSSSIVVFSLSMGISASFVLFVYHALLPPSGETVYWSAVHLISSQMFVISSYHDKGETVCCRLYPERDSR